jgi:hypothetical protein
MRGRGLRRRHADSGHSDSRQPRREEMLKSYRSLKPAHIDLALSYATDF